ncbi:MAG: DUF58 domain-containing protein [Anaerolineales bacterium]|jgi:uncharacterized protein (DUF58 family)
MPAAADRQPKISIHLKNRLLPVLVVVLFAWQLISPAKVWMMLLIGLGGALALGWVWVRMMAPQLSLERELRYGWAQVGDRLQERFTLKNSSALPALWVEVMDFSDLPGESANRVASVSAHTSTRWITERLCEQRGVYTLGPTAFVVADPLGIFTARLDYAQQSGLMVMPPIVPLTEIEVAPGGRAGEGRRRSQEAIEITVSASGVHEYQPGDPISKIHWPTTARRDQLYSRQFDSMPASDWWIFLDLDSRVQAGEGWNSTEEHGIILAASLADAGLRRGLAVGLVASGEKLAWLAPQVGLDQRLLILQALTTIELGQITLTQLLGRAVPRFSRSTSLVVITSNVQGAWLEELLPLAAKGVVPTIILLDPGSFGGSGSSTQLANLLTRFNLHHYVLTKELLDRPETRPGQRGLWEWKVLGTGRAIAVRKPADVEWRRLA